MRILHLGTDSFGGHGGIALFNREFATALATYGGGTEVVVLPRLIPNEPESLPANVRFLADAAHGRSAYLWTLMRVAARERIDLVVCGHVNLLPIARMVAKDPLLVTHGIEAWKPLRDPLSRRLLHDCRAVVSVSDLTRRRFVEWSHFRGRTFVLPNAVRAAHYGVRAKRADLIERYGLAGKRVLLTVGRLAASERYKGFDEVIEILPSLPADVVYLIAGGGDDTQRLVKKAADLGLGDRVIFTGRFAEADKPDLYALADLYVMPSLGEGFGFVFLEALASGVPAIASKHDGGREALRDGQLGLLVDPSSPAEIRAAIVELLDGRPRAVPPGLDYFSFANFEARVHEIVSSILH